MLTDNLERGRHVINHECNVPKTMPVHSGFRFLEVRRVPKYLERWAVIAEAR